ncbi:hypothetical protein BVC80_1837g343 [Macleaya cordata]|uniref:Uncharacterized protein n=1 Tax=Macleaya cordata TaxID=56857 RepID=A0A200R467_MACCD|nr:hypothetical protein BVC80_1837g343 [Macleaya cordata]
MALSGIGEMFGARTNSYNKKFGLAFHRSIGRNYSKSRRSSGMGFELDQTESWKFLESKTAFIHWSRRILLGEGYHEFL